MAVTWTRNVFTFTSLNSLAQDAWAFSAQEDLTAIDAHDVWIGGSVTTDADYELDETLELYLAIPADPDNLTTTIGGGIATGLAGADAVETEGTDFMQEGLIFVGQNLTRANQSEAYHFTPFSLLSACGGIPPGVQLVVHNNSDDASETFSASGHSFTWSTFKYPTT